MFTFIGLIVVAVIILYRRSTEIIKVNPMRGAGPAAPVLRGPSDEEEAPSIDFGRLINTIQQASQVQSSETTPRQGLDAIRALVRSNQFIEAIQLYRRMYGTDLLAAKKAVDKLMLEQ